MNSIELKKEEEYLNNTLTVIDGKIKELGSGLDVSSDAIAEFKRYIFKERGSMDSVEIRSNMISSSMEENAFMRKSKYLKKLYQIKNNPYFGRIDVILEKLYPIYIGITYLEKDDEHLIYDWRSPVANLFYDSEIGDTCYESPEGTINCSLINKRQYKIVERKIKHIFDNNLNIDDDVLQEVLVLNSSDKMKNIVNTIQKEQNNIIRNITDKHLIVQGIAGSGKTSVALHRIAYLLYRLDNLSSSNVLIFSPNDIFSEYIANVLPELGEDNTKETTFSSFAVDYVKEYREIESFTDFVSRHYEEIDNDSSLISFKQSNEIINVLENYVQELTRNIHFTDDLEYLDNTYSKELLNNLFHERYNHLNIIDRFYHISDFLANNLGLNSKNRLSIESKLYKIVNFKKDYKKIYYNFYLSNSFTNYYGFINEINIKSFVNKKVLNYEDSLLFIYLKGLIQGFPYSNQIKEIVVDEAQDYSILQYIILKKIFKRASFTILGDVNQTINPYYHYRSLSELERVLNDDTKYMELTKTYRSSAEIIEYANKILGLSHVVSIRKGEIVPVIERHNITDLSILKNDIKELICKYQKTCIITKTSNECNRLYNYLKSFFNLTNMLSYNIKDYNPDLIIIPSFLAKGLEFDSVIVYNDINNAYTKDEKYLFYVSVTRSRHKLIVYNN